jgi:hypothetical protein
MAPEAYGTMRRSSAEHVAADDGFPGLSVHAWPEHHGGGGGGDIAAVAAGGHRAEAGGSLSSSSGAPCHGTGPEFALAAGGRNRGGAGDWGFFSPMCGPSHRAVEADRWAATAHGAHKAVAQRGREPAERVRDAGRVRFNGSVPLELRNGFLILDKGFPLLQNRK